MIFNRIYTWWELEAMERTSVTHLRWAPWLSTHPSEWTANDFDGQLVI